MATSSNDDYGSGGLRLGMVQFAFTLGWTTYALMLPTLLAQAGIAPSWLPAVLMADQAIFALMDIGFGAIADRMKNVFRSLARLLLVLTTLSALAFLLLPLVAGVSSGLLLATLLLWVVSASVVRAPTLILLAKRAKAQQRQGLVIWYSAGIGLAMALSPFLGLWLRGADPRWPFVVSALTLLVAVWVLLRESGFEPPATDSAEIQPPPFSTCLPLFVVLGVAGLAFQLHAFVNSSPLYQMHAAKEVLPWLMPTLWVGFFAALVAMGGMVKRFGAMPVATVGLCVVAVSSYWAPNAASLGGLVVTQLLCGAGWALAFAGLMEQASAASSRGAEGKVMGSFFAVTALSGIARIAIASGVLPDWQNFQFTLPSALLLLAAAIAAVDSRKWAKIRMR